MELYQAILSRDILNVRKLALMGGKNIMNAKDRVGTARYKVRYLINHSHHDLCISAESQVTKMVSCPILN